MTADSPLIGLEKAMGGALKLTRLEPERAITLVTENGLAMTARQTAYYLV
jgi:hypothetical protein